MVEIQEQDTAQEPVTENSGSVSTQEGQAEKEEAPSELILGKFKSVEDLTKAYEKLERRQGLQSQEIGQLRNESNFLNSLKQVWNKSQMIKQAKDELQASVQKYDTPEYFQNQAFRKLYGEAFKAFGKNLDPERLVNLVEDYVSSRIYALEKSKAAQSETEKIVNSMSFSKNKSSSTNPPKKRLDEMTPKEVDELLERLI